MPSSAAAQPGYFGPFGGRFVAETLLPALDELTHAVETIVRAEPFQKEWRELLGSYVGRPTPLTEARRLHRLIDPKGTSLARLLMKREDCCHTGAHKINNALGQALLAKKMGKTRVIADDRTRAQCIDRTGAVPDAAIACVGGGSNAIGLFRAFMPDASVALYGVEAAGHGVASGSHAATLTAGRVGVLHGSKSYLCVGDPCAESSRRRLRCADRALRLLQPAVRPRRAALDR